MPCSPPLTSTRSGFRATKGLIVLCAKVGASNWPVLAHLDVLAGLGHRVLVGASRKRFVGAVLGDDQGPESREHATTAITALAANAGGWGVRVHNARAAKDAVSVVSAWQQGSEA